MTSTWPTCEVGVVWWVDEVMRQWLHHVISLTQLLSRHHCILLTQQIMQQPGLRQLTYIHTTTRSTSHGKTGSVSHVELELTLTWHILQKFLGYETNGEKPRGMSCVSAVSQCGILSTVLSSETFWTMPLEMLKNALLVKNKWLQRTEYLCSSRRLLRCVALGMGCTILQCLAQLSLASLQSR